MGWGKEWPAEVQKLADMMLKDIPVISGIDFGTGDSQTVMTTFEEGKIKHKIIPYEELYDVSSNFENLIKAYATVRNRKPTHDPYINPNAHIYYECTCGTILDPQTKSFAQLNNHASDKGWKIRFTDKGYVPYCVKCGEGVE